MIWGIGSGPYFTREMLEQIYSLAPVKPKPKPESKMNAVRNPPPKQHGPAKRGRW